MKEKPIVTYTKHGDEIKKTLTYFNKYSIINTLFDHPFEQVNNWDFYEVNEGITKIHLKNVIFYRDIKFICPKETTLILENCQFNGANLYFFGGNIQLINPKLPSYYYCNNISGSGIENFYANVKDEFLIDLNFSINAKKISIDGESRIRNIYITGKEIKLTDISELKSMSLIGEKVIIKESKIKKSATDTQSSLKKILIQTDELELHDSTIYIDELININYQNLTKDENSNIIQSELLPSTTKKLVRKNS